MYKLMQVEEPIDIFVSHDWPLGITDYGNWEQLVRQKPFFEKEVIRSVPRVQFLVHKYKTQVRVGKNFIFIIDAHCFCILDKLLIHSYKLSFIFIINFQLLLQHRSGTSYLFALFVGIFS